MRKNINVSQGKDGRFQLGSSSGKSKKAKTTDGDDWLVTDPVPGGPTDDTVIPSFLGHRAYTIWMGKEKDSDMILKIHNRPLVCEKLQLWYENMPQNTKKKIDETRLSHLPICMFKSLDWALITAFTERWQPDTNTFHMPFGEMTILMHDVYWILKIPVEGYTVSDDASSEDLKNVVRILLGKTDQDMLKDKKLWENGGVSTDVVFTECEASSSDTQAIAWMWLMLGCTLFLDKSGSKLRPNCLLEVKDGVADSNNYSWGSATLAFLYRQLGMGSRSKCSQMSGCMTLLQAWIYEYFPCFRPQAVGSSSDLEMPRSNRWLVPHVARAYGVRLSLLRAEIDRLTASEVTWLPFGPEQASRVPRTAFSGWIRYRDVVEPYMPARALRQLGYVQCIPPPITRPVTVVRASIPRKYKVEVSNIIVEDSWRQFPNVSIVNFNLYKSSFGDRAACVLDYISWYFTKSHPLIVSQDSDTSGDPPWSNSAYWFNESLTFYKHAIEALKQYAPPEVANNHLFACGALQSRWTDAE
ncbi:hydrolase protein serine/threonine phosphatase [Euphorbia peplus]|nr:hydrolase protein serine/threonine phosphatase [Euphorbia peplus]WCJ32647.1 hydrolase protein serine/threonine phosphatase [Euphorbia peplus]WCJ36180.1 hydrolase protein serine/threonine phosphatase [Euphorbia peplus]